MNRQQASDAVTDLGWRLVLGKLCTQIPVTSYPEAVSTAELIVREVDAPGHVLLDLRPDRVLVTVWTVAQMKITQSDIEIARQISELGLKTNVSSQPVQQIEIAVDAMDIPAVRPFWKAVFGYTDEPDSGPEGGLVDPNWQSPTIWFQQMDSPRTQRNRIHFDVSVPHDEAAHRIAAAVEAGGRVISDAEAPAFWVLADVEGNEVCVTTWQGRD